jgi:hypothetical protein
MRTLRRSVWTWGCVDCVQYKMQRQNEGVQKSRKIVSCGLWVPRYCSGVYICNALLWCVNDMDAVPCMHCLGLAMVGVSGSFCGSDFVCCSVHSLLGLMTERVSGG